MCVRVRERMEADTCADEVEVCARTMCLCEGGGWRVKKEVSLEKSLDDGVALSS